MPLYVSGVKIERPFMVSSAKQRKTSMFQSLTSAVERTLDQFGVFALLAVGMAAAGATALTGASF